MAAPARRCALVSLTSGWPIALAALAGAWLGHLLEYIRVAGWHAGLVEMTSTVHAYYFPAGAAIVALVVLAGAQAARAWRRLSHRLRRAQAGLWRRPVDVPAPDDVHPHTLALGQVWAILTMLQLAIWVVQENLEGVAAGRAAPMLGVLAGAHSLAPVIQAEVALILAVGLVTIGRRFDRQGDRIRVVERLVSRKWSRAATVTPAPTLARGVPSTPAERWGVHRWQRPPPPRVIAA